MEVPLKGNASHSGWEMTVRGDFWSAGNGHTQPTSPDAFRAAFGAVMLGLSVGNGRTHSPSSDVCRAVSGAVMLGLSPGPVPSSKKPNRAWSKNI